MSSLEKLYQIPRIHLAQLPSPIQEITEFKSFIQNHRFFLKREDLTGFAFGGNKVRSTEFIFSDLLAKEANVVIACAGPHSNFLRVIAAASKKHRIEAKIIMYGAKPPKSEGNLLIENLLEIEPLFTNEMNRESAENLGQQIYNKLLEKKMRPYIIPRGGAMPEGCIAYVLFVKELQDQLIEKKIKIDHLVVPVGSCTTITGILIGAALFNANYKVWGLSVSRTQKECLEQINSLTIQTLSRIGTPNYLPHKNFSIIETLGKGYGIPSPETNQLIKDVAQATGVFFDPIYTGKAFWGVTNLIKENKIKKGESILFVHTGGEPSLFSSLMNINSLF